MHDRIKVILAEAMGWESYQLGDAGGDYHWRWKKQNPRGEILYRKVTPDPFTDANDDYAVLEWARETFESAQWYEFCDALWSLFQIAQGTTVDQGRTLGHYRKGFYARAALKVIANE